MLLEALETEKLGHPDRPMKTGPGKTGAIVVTFNRLDCLRISVHNLRGQTCPLDKIIIVNNGSTDGTAEWLAQQSDLHVINQENLGSGEGFRLGMSVAYESGCEWLWLMDDDLVVPEDALARLIEKAAAEEIPIINPLIAADTEPDNLSFGLSPQIRTVAAAQEAAKAGLIEGLINPFNGFLIHRRALDQIGLVKGEMFMSGDEVEYMLRARKHGLRLATFASVICLHPKDRSAYAPILGNRARVEVPKGRRFWIYARNLGFINWHYRGWYSLIRDGLKYTCYFLFTPRSESGSLADFWRYYLDGITDTYRLPPARLK